MIVESEQDTGGFLAPSITILARTGWKGDMSLENCQQGCSKNDLIKFKFYSLSVPHQSKIFVRCQDNRQLNVLTIYCNREVRKNNCI